MGISVGTFCLLLWSCIVTPWTQSCEICGLRWSFRSLIIGIGLAGFSMRCTSRQVSLSSYCSISGTFNRRTSDLFSSFYMVQHPPVLAIPFFLQNPFFEELIVRAYLMTEIGELTGSWLLAVLVSSLVQASYHLYYGMGRRAASCFFSSCILSIYYRAQGTRDRRAWNF